MLSYKREKTNFIVKSGRYHLTWVIKVRIRNRTNQPHAPLWQDTLRSWQHPFWSVPAKNAGVDLLLRKGQMSPNWGLFYKPLACNLKKYQDHESQGKTEELFQDWRRPQRHDSSVQQWRYAAFFCYKGRLVGLRQVGGLGSGNVSVVTCWFWWMYCGYIRECPSWDFPGGPVVKNPWHTGDNGLIPGQGTKIPHATGQLSLRATATESMHRKQKIPHDETQILWAATKAQWGQINTWKENALL